MFTSKRLIVFRGQLSSQEIEFLLLEQVVQTDGNKVQHPLLHAPHRLVVLDPEVERRLGDITNVHRTGRHGSKTLEFRFGRRISFFLDAAKSRNYLLKCPGAKTLYGWNVDPPEEMGPESRIRNHDFTWYLGEAAPVNGLAGCYVSTIGKAA